MPALAGVQATMSLVVRKFAERRRSRGATKNTPQFSQLQLYLKTQRRTRCRNTGRAAARQRRAAAASWPGTVSFDISAAWETPSRRQRSAQTRGASSARC